MVPQFIKRKIRDLMQKLGLDLSRYRPETNKWQAQKCLLDMHITKPVILDIGANIGQTVESYKSIFPNSRIHSFEPYPDSFNKLNRLAVLYPDVNTYPIAIADKAGNQSFYVNEIYHPTNSLLPRPASGHRYFPEGAHLEEKIVVETDTIDAFTERNRLNEIDILKMDIQGGELAALKGACNMLKKQAIKLVLTEIMFVSLYEGAALFEDIHAHLSSTSYTLYGIYDRYFAENGQLRFADAIYINRDLRNRIEHL